MFGQSDASWQKCSPTSRCFLENTVSLRICLEVSLYVDSLHDLSDILMHVFRLKVKRYSSPEEAISVTCHVGSHSVTYHPTQVNTPRCNPCQTSLYSIYLPWRDGRLSWFSRPQTVTRPHSRSRDLLITSLTP